MLIDAAALSSAFDVLPNRPPPGFNSIEESEHVKSLVESELSEYLKDYSDPRAEGAGGSGIIISAVYKPFKTRRAIKLPRKRIYQDGKNEPAAEVDPEIHALSKLSHEHITKLYDHRRLETGAGHCTITEYVSAAKPLNDYAFSLCTTKECREDRHLLETNLRRLSQIIYELAETLRYMHLTAKLIHFDIKPDNLLVSATGEPFITDLGFARDTTKYKANDLIQVGFTWKYAHPTLRDPDHGGRISQTPARAKNHVTGADLAPIVDLFAFGRTIQEVLKRLENEYGESIYSIYDFNYLHVVACLCLDGQNAANHFLAPGYTFVSDQALGLPISLFKAQKFSDFSQVTVALQRLLGMRRLEDDLPELDRWSPNTINASDLGLTTMTPRVISIVNHPAFARLGDELQLGMLDTVFPTATHTRLQHTLGVFHGIAEYITALYYDAENPTFRVLFDRRDAERALIAALLHDIGQMSFGHEMEEVDAEEFSHLTIGLQIAESEHFKNADGQTLKEVVESESYDGWGMALEEVFNLLGNRLQRPVNGLYHDLLDGQLDADKLDYLIRDSKETRVQYGAGIDTERFLRSLTTIGAIGGENKPFLRLAVKKKGSASAEAFAFARYQLYQSLYWHHTFRAAKAMLLTAASEIIAEVRSKKSEQLFGQHLLRELYIRFACGLDTDIKPSRSKKDDVASELARKLESPGPTNTDYRYSRDKTLTFLWKLASGKSRMLIDDLMSRRYYKRVMEIPLGSLREEAWMKLRDRFLGDKADATRKSIADSLLSMVRTAVQDQSSVRESIVEDDVLAEVDRVASTHHTFVVDLPLRGWSPGGGNPTFVSDYKRRHFRAQVADNKGQEEATLWNEHIGPMMRKVAVFRVFCEPRLHQILTRVVRSDGVQSAIQEALPELR